MKLLCKKATFLDSIFYITFTEIMWNTGVCTDIGSVESLNLQSLHFSYARSLGLLQNN